MHEVVIRTDLALTCGSPMVRLREMLTVRRARQEAFEASLRLHVAGVQALFTLPSPTLGRQLASGSSVRCNSSIGR